VDGRETWQALQGRLTNARVAIEAGDRSRALAEISAALEIDPEFLAAHALRDRILEAVPEVPASIPDVPAAPVVPDALGPPAFVDILARLEERAKRRLADRANSAAVAFEDGPVQAVAPPFDEPVETDPEPAEVPVIAAQLGTVPTPRAEPRARLGPRLVAAAVFVAAVLGASMLHDSTSLFSHPTIAAAALVAAPTPGAILVPDSTAAGTVTGTETEPDTSSPAISPVEQNANAALVAPATAPASDEMLQILAPAPPPIAPAPPVGGSAPEARVAAAMITPMPAPAAPLADDNLLVAQALQRYRTAYDGLDAQLAHAVWPAVNQVALARAFDGLESQSLTFDACDVRVHGESATATCQGSARYVPKIGSREPRVEPRVWNFSLHKADGDWKIESARAER
jgi:hypothetical protein